jgi:hypothetical protein
MRAAVKLLEPRARALAGAKVRAWWNGADFDQAAFEASLEKPAEAPVDGDAGEHLFEPPPDPRLDGLQRIWGAGRLAPASAPALTEAGEDAAIALLGPGLAGSAGPYAGYKRIEIFEWRVEAREALKSGLAKAGLERAALTALDLDLTTLAAETFEALVSFDEFTYAANPARLALQIARTLKPGAKAVIEAYAGANGADIAGAFASAFAEPQLHVRNALLHAFGEAGLDVDSDEDISEAHSAAARAAFQAFAEKAEEIKQVAPEEMREIGWEIETWRARLKLLTLKRIQRHRFCVHRRV